MAPRVPVSRVVFAYLCVSGAGAALAILFAAAAAAEPPSPEFVERGRYLVQIMDCGGCHNYGAFTPTLDPARRLAGNPVGFSGPWGVVYPPNLTSDEETGLGRWTDEQVLRAVRYGQRPDGRQLTPAMPWDSFSHLNEEDGRAMVAYLRSLPPVSHQVPPPVAPGQRAPAPYLQVVDAH